MGAGRLLDLLGALLLLFWCVPVVTPRGPPSDVLHDRHGALLGARIASDEQWRFPLAGPVPERYALAVETFEDRRFRHHPGVDPLAVLRAVRLNLTEGRVVSGASTLTMQTVRIARGNPPRTLPEKLWEMVLALRLELVTSKDEVLAAYAAHAPFGGNTVGVEAAAWRYYGRPADQLSWAEAATLAVLPNSPALVHPGRNRDALRAKRDRLLDALVTRGHLSPADAELAKLEELPAAPRPVPRLAPHLLDATRGRVVSTLDATLQARVTEAVRLHHRGLAASRIHNAAVLVLHLPTGEALAYVGNAPSDDDAAHGHQVDVVRALRSTGSTLKPFLVAEMLEDGVLLPRQLVPDTPMRLGGFSPQNFDRAFEGAVRVDDALARSRNVPAAWLLREYGVDRFHRRLQERGLTSLTRSASDYGLSLVLGGAEASLWELTELYRHLGWSALGQSEPPPAARWRGEPVPSVARLGEPAAAWLTLRALFDVSRPGVHAHWRQFGSGRQVAWKTGTSFGFRDGWAIAVTTEHAVGVWVGNADGEGRPELTGVQAAAPLLFDVLDRLPRSEPFTAPAGLVRVEVCAHSGLPAGPDCAHREWDDAPPAARDAPPCDRCAKVHLDAEGRRAHAGCADVRSLTATSWSTLPAAQEVFYAPRHPDYAPLPDWAPGCEPPEEERPRMSLLSPKASSQVAVPVELDGRRGRLVFEAAHRDPDAVVHWHLDGDYLTSTRHVHQVESAPAPGHHELVLVDAAGGRVARRFEVVGR